MKKTIMAVSAGVLLLGGTASASMLDQLIYNIAGQATNAAGARIGDEIYYGSSRSSHRAPQRKHVKHRHKKHKKSRKAAVVSMTDEMRIQKALTSLGYYHGPIDGEVNSFETRSAIKKLNIYYGISNSASLKSEVKDALIFLGTLFSFDRNLIARGTDTRTKGKKIQTALKIHGFYHAKIDGAVGSGTRRAIAEYKAAQGLSSGSKLDFEEEYQLISTAKAMNDRNIEETLASLQALGNRNAQAVQTGYVQPGQHTVQPQYRQPQQAPVQQSRQPVSVPQYTGTAALQPVTAAGSSPVTTEETSKKEPNNEVSVDSLEMYTDK